MQSRDRRRAAGVLLLSALLTTVSWLWSSYPAMAGEPPSRDVESHRYFSEFALNNWSGDEFTLDSLRDAAAIIVFTYAKCVFGCPMITFYLKNLDQELGHPEDLRFVHISVNPQLDNAQEIQKHFLQFEIDPTKDPRWVFLNGPEDRIEALLADNDITVKKTPMKDGVLIDHTILVQVVGRDSRIVAEFPTYLWDEERMADALQAALEPR